MTPDYPEFRARFYLPLHSITIISMEISETFFANFQADYYPPANQSYVTHL